MKIKTLKIKKSFKKENFKINPNAYWKIIVMLFFLLIIGISFFAFNFFQRIDKKEESSLENNSVKIEKEKKDKINKVLDYFNEREKKSIEILNSPSGVIDPSL